MEAHPSFRAAGLHEGCWRGKGQIKLNCRHCQNRVIAKLESGAELSAS